MAKQTYDCLKCVGYCCAIYERVHVADADIKRLAKHFKVTFETARQKFTKQDSEPGERVLRRTADPIFGSSCMFQHPDTRLCTIYDARPKTCREWPAHGRKGACVYYDILDFERNQQEDPDYVPVVQIMLFEGIGGKRNDEE